MKKKKNIEDVDFLKYLTYIFDIVLLVASHPSRFSSSVCFVSFGISPPKKLPNS